LLAQGHAKNNRYTDSSMQANLISNQNQSLFSSLNSPASASLRRTPGGLQVQIPQRSGLGSVLLSPLLIRRESTPSPSFKQPRKDYSIGQLEDIKEVEGEGGKGRRKKTFQINVRKSGPLDPLEEEKHSSQNSHNDNRNSQKENKLRSIV